MSEADHSTPVVLGADHALSLSDLLDVARHRRPVSVDDWSALEASRAWLEGHVESWRQGGDAAPIYGITTGFGSLRHVKLTPEEIEDVQANLIRSHAVGVVVDAQGEAGEGGCFPPEVVRAVLLVRVHTFLKGRSAVRRVLAERLLAFLEHDLLPRVPQRGSVGASGDLCPLSHLALAVLGEGDASLPDADGGRRRLPASEALAELGLEPLPLSYKEGLALINGTTFSLATLALACADAETLARSADVSCALGLEAIGGQTRALDAKVHECRGQPGQVDAAASLRALLAESRWVATSDDTQDSYSYRCAPQVHGASRDALSHVRSVVERELQAVTDNPLIFALDGDGPPFDQEQAENPRRFGREVPTDLAYSAGNFHGQPVAVAADILSLAVAELADIAERRVALLVDPHRSRGLPPHLASRAGLRSGLMLAQYTAASLVSENKTLAHPASVDSIPTGNGAEDHVPMATWAARKARQVVALTARVIALELLTASQACDWRRVVPDPASPAPDMDELAARDRSFEALADDVVAELGAGTREAQGWVRGRVPRVVEDRELAGDVERLSTALLTGSLVTAVGGRSRPLRRALLVAPEAGDAASS